MSVMAVGPGRTIDGPLPEAPDHNLLATAEEINPDRWVSGGLVLWPFPTDLPSGVDPCLEGTFRQKDSGTESDGTHPEFPAFTVYQPIICTAFLNDFEGLKLRAEAVLNATDHLVAEQQLASGTYATAPYLGDGANNYVVLATGVAPEVGLSYLEQAIGETGKAGMIHADPATAAAWTIGRQLQERGGRLETVARGTPVVVGDGYIGALADGVAAGVGSSWAFATGPVQYARGELVRLSDAIAESMDRESNTVVYIAERDLVVAWDLELQAAVSIDWTP